MSSSVSIKPLPQPFGAVVEGLDMSQELTPEIVDQLRQAWLKHLVLFFPALHLTDAQHITLGSAFGELAALGRTQEDQKQDKRGLRTGGPNNEILILRSEEIRIEKWHSDVSFVESPPTGSLLSMQLSPEIGGETSWSNQYAAYDSLSAPVKAMIADMKAEHSLNNTGKAIHPVVRLHPETNRPALYVSRTFTKRILGVSEIESDGILAMLFRHAEEPDYQIRWQWKAGDAGLWDNRCLTHRGISNYGNALRVLHRVTIYDRGEKSQLF